MGNGKITTTATTLILVVAMTALAIAISSNAWMKLKHKTDYFDVGMFTINLLKYVIDFYNIYIFSLNCGNSNMYYHFRQL